MELMREHEEASMELKHTRTHTHTQEEASMELINQ